jgi:hypothetical protein
MSEALLKALGATIGEGAPLDSMIEILRAHRDAGVRQPEAMAVLELLRSKASTEAEEDRILELMDLTNGFCSAHVRLY